MLTGYKSYKTAIHLEGLRYMGPEGVKERRTVANDQTGCASDLALSPKVRLPAEPVPIWAYNITLSTSAYLYTERLSNDCVSETIDAINT
jgi:hypothetical protein